MTNQAYKRLRETVGPRTYVAKLLGLHPKHVAKREQGRQRISREAELALRWIALKEDGKKWEA